MAAPPSAPVPPAWTAHCHSGSYCADRLATAKSGNMRQRKNMSLIISSQAGGVPMPVSVSGPGAAPSLRTRYQVGTLGIPLILQLTPCQPGKLNPNYLPSSESSSFSIQTTLLWRRGQPVSGFQRNNSVRSFLVWTCSSLCLSFSDKVSGSPSQPTAIMVRGSRSSGRSKLAAASLRLNPAMLCI